MTRKIAVLIDAEIHNELVLRTRKTKDVTDYIEHAIRTFLERTERDDELWDADYISKLDEVEEVLLLAKYGAPEKGYQWQAVFIPNGSNLRITYKGMEHFAEIRHGDIIADNTAYSPSGWARRVANNTSRNAWTDIWIKLPDAQHWQSADEMRWAVKEARS